MSMLWVFLMGGLLTFGMRFSFIYLLGRVALPDGIRRMLRFVPAAVLSAIVAPELLMHSGSLDLSLGNPYLLAGAIAVIAAIWIRNTLLTILIGMAALVILQLI
jgi:branched-subunit amino acid transport protein